MINYSKEYKDTIISRPVLLNKLSQNEEGQILTTVHNKCFDYDFR